jgi:predicted kinase
MKNVKINMASFKILYLLRGLPGSGKSTLANQLSDQVCEADSYFMVYTDPITGQKQRHYYDGVYEFDVNLLRQAHNDCKNLCEDYMKSGYETVVVSNTLTSEKELTPYTELAEKYGYQLVSLVVENRHGNRSIHDVPDETLERMETRLKNSIKLR